jgi:hypothetical protein
MKGTRLGKDGVKFMGFGPIFLFSALQNRVFFMNNLLFIFLIIRFQVKEACEKYGVPLGLYTKDGASARERVEKDGVKFVGFGADFSFLLNQAGAQAAEARGEDVRVGGYMEMYRGLG